MVTTYWDPNGGVAAEKGQPAIRYAQGQGFAPGAITIGTYDPGINLGTSKWVSQSEALALQQQGLADYQASGQSNPHMISAYQATIDQLQGAAPSTKSITSENFPVTEATAPTNLPSFYTAPNVSYHQAFNDGVSGQGTGSVAGVGPLGQISPTGVPSPAQTTISNPVTPPSAVGSVSAPTFATPQGAQAANQFNTSIAASTQATKDALQAEADKRAAEYQRQIDGLKTKETELQQLQDAGMLGLKDTTFKESADKQKELDLEKQRFDENYNASQALIGELGTLLTQGNQAVEQMLGTTGLASIMNPRISKTMSDVSARAGVIQAVLSARSNQMSQAQNQLQAATNAISSIYGDQLDYYKTVVNYYAGLKDENNNKILNITKDQKQYADMKINLLENDLNQLQATSQAIQKAMLDPDTALMYAKAGVTLNDSVEGINRKLATYQYSQEVYNISNTMSGNGYSQFPIAGVAPVQITDSQGNVRNYYKAPELAVPGQNNYTLGMNQVRFDDQNNVVAVGPTKATEDTVPGSAYQEISPGATVFDPVTGQAVFTAPTTPSQAGTANDNNSIGPAKSKQYTDLGYKNITPDMTQAQADAAVAAQQKPSAASGYPTVNLQPGSTDTANVKKLQDWLVANGYMTQEEVNTGYGNYGAKTTAAVAKVQQQYGVDNTGAVGYWGPKTLAALTGGAPSPATKATTSGGGGGSTATTSGFGDLSNANQTAIVNYIFNNGGTQADVDAVKNDRDAQAKIMSFIGSSGTTRTAD